MKKFEGVIFDFNGTLFWDTEMHNQAWDLFLGKHNIRLTDKEKDEHVHGKNNRDTLQSLFESSLNDEQIENFIEEKEDGYRQICSSQKRELAPGAVNFIEFLQKVQIPYTIATASVLSNVNFYFDFLGLDRWFDKGKVVYDNGFLKSKPHPDFFTTAMRVLGIEPNLVMVFEDSMFGIQAAENARAGKIIVVNSKSEDLNGQPHEWIDSFDQVNRDLFI